MNQEQQNEKQDLRQVRIDKISSLRAKWVHPYPSRFEKTHSCADAKWLADWIDWVAIAWRIMLYRSFWSLAFATIQDVTWKMQVAFQKNKIWDEIFKLAEKDLDLWDFIWVKWEMFTTKHWEKTVLIKEFTFLGKALRPLPEKFHWLHDEEVQYRQRYLDLIMNEDSMQRFKARTKIIKHIREFLEIKWFDEIETPVLSSIAWGAAAKPFFSHHNALDIEVTMRIAPELYLKRAIVWWYEKVFEFAKCFRNEWMDPSHLQEFTMLEFYQAFADFNDTMKLTEEMFNYLFDHAFWWQRKFMIKDRDWNDTEIDFTTPWPRLKFRDVILQYSWIDIYIEKDKDSLLKAIQKKWIKLEDKDLKQWYGNLCDTLYKKTARPNLINPCFVIEHPIQTKPLARKSDENPEFADTYQLLINTWEIVNAYSELVDPIDQNDRLVEQAKAKTEWDEEAFEMDEDYVIAMEHGMPPISWWGLWVDRLVTLLTWRDNLRDVVLFPMLKPNKKELSAKEAEERYRSKKLVVIADKDAEPWVVANAIWQLWIEIWAFTNEQLFDQKHLYDAENRLHFVDALYPMANLWWTQKDMANFVLACHENGIQPFDFSDIMRKAHSDKQMTEWYKKLKTKDIWYIAVWALLPVKLAEDLTKWLKLYWEK